MDVKILGTKDGEIGQYNGETCFYVYGHLVDEDTYDLIVFVDLEYRQNKEIHLKIYREATRRTFNKYSISRVTMNIDHSSDLEIDCLLKLGFREEIRKHKNSLVGKAFSCDRIFFDF